MDAAASCFSILPNCPAPRPALLILRDIETRSFVSGSAIGLPGAGSSCFARRK
jgi:hypothetical protein